MIVFHGSDKIIEKPEFGKGYIYNDYGRGFYLTADENLAGEWAVLRTGFDGYINRYELDLNGLNILDTDKIKTENLIAILIKNRDIEFAEAFSDDRDLFVEKYDLYIDDYDVIMGIRANDRFYSYMRAFITGTVTREAVAKLFGLGNWGTQICVKSERAFANLKFIGYTDAFGEIYYSNALNRNKLAGNLYKNMDRKTLRDGSFISDLI